MCGRNKLCIEIVDTTEDFPQKFMSFSEFQSRIDSIEDGKKWIHLHGDDTLDHPLFWLFIEYAIQFSNLGNLQVYGSS